MRALRVGSKGWCRNCGFAVIVVQVSKQVGFNSWKFRTMWVHTHGMEQHCFWTAQPKRHRKPADRTLYEQLSDLRARIRELEGR